MEWYSWRCSEASVQCTLQCAVYSTVCSVLYTVQCTLHCTLYSTLYTVLYSVQCTVQCAVYCALYSVLYIVQCTLHYTVYSAVYSVLYNVQCTCFVSWTSHCISTDAESRLLHLSFSQLTTVWHCISLVISRSTLLVTVKCTLVLTVVVSALQVASCIVLYLC